MVSCNFEIYLCRGGLQWQYDVQEGEGVMENWTNLDKGREGVKNPGNFADVLYEWSLKQLPSSWPLSAAQLPLHFMNKHANQQVTLSDLIGPGNLAVDFICRGLMSINNFVLNPTLRVFVLKLATR